MDGPDEKVIVNAEVIAKFLECTPRRVWQLATEGMPKIDRGHYPLIEAVQWYIRRIRGRNQQVLSLDESRQRKINAEAKLAEIELAKAQKQVIAVSDHADLLGDIADLVKIRLLSIPITLAPMVSIESKETVCREILDNEIRKCLEELYRVLSDDRRRENESQGGTKKSGKKVPPAAEAKRRRVGRPRKGSVA